MQASKTLGVSAQCFMPSHQSLYDTAYTPTCVVEENLPFRIDVSDVTYLNTAVGLDDPDLSLAQLDFPLTAPDVLS